jgi:hypothetical protein
MTFTPMTSVEAKQAQDEHDDDHEADQIDDAVHGL